MPDRPPTPLPSDRSAIPPTGPSAIARTDLVPRAPELAAPLDAAAAAVGDRWTLLVVDALRVGPLRFADLAQRLPGVAPNVLTRRLRDLQASGLVTAEPYSERPPRQRYALSPLGRALEPVLAALARWGEQLTEQIEANVSLVDDDDGETRYA